MLLSFGFVFLLASAHALPTTPDTTSSEVEVVPDDEPVLRPVVKAPKFLRTRTGKGKATNVNVNDDPPTAADNEMQKSQRKALAPILGNIASMLGGGNIMESLIKGSPPMFNGLVETLRNYATQQLNNNKPVSRMVIVILEATRFLMEIMDFFAKRGDTVLKIITSFFKLTGGIISSLTGGAAEIKL